jgi:hypothetical protein
LALSFVPIVLSGFLMVKLMRDNTAKDEILQSKEAASEVNYRMDVLLSGIQDSFTAMGKNAAINTVLNDPENTQDAYTYLYETTAGYRSYANFSVYGANGNCILSTDMIKDLPSYWGILEDAKASPDTMVIRSEGDSKTPVLRIAQAIVKADQVSGYLLASLDNTNMAYLLSGIVSAQEGINIMDFHMETAYCSGPADALTVNNSLRSEIIRTGTVPLKLGNYNIYFTPIPKMGFYVVLLKQPLLSDSTVSGMYPSAVYAWHCQYYPLLLLWHGGSAILSRNR